VAEGNAARRPFGEDRVDIVDLEPQRSAVRACSRLFLQEDRKADPGVELVTGEADSAIVGTSGSAFVLPKMSPRARGLAALTSGTAGNAAHGHVDMSAHRILDQRSRALRECAEPGLGHARQELGAQMLRAAAAIEP
jgi:hypothetical protein